MVGPSSNPGGTFASMGAVPLSVSGTPAKKEESLGITTIVIRHFTAEEELL